MSIAKMTIMPDRKKFLAALAGERQACPPFWLMRQAGRYLPEYRAVREKAGGFLNLAFTPELAAEVTLQPLRRYGMDAAILFSDILVIPLALGQSVAFAQGEGPVLSPVRSVEALKHLDMERFDAVLAPVYEAVRQIRSGMEREGFSQTALVGFAGAPWTVACYMVEGGSSRDFMHVKRWAYGDPTGFKILIDRLVDATARYLCAQIEAGVEAVQIFDSWAGALDEAQFEAWAIEPTQRIVSAVKAAHPHIPVIGFPRGAGLHYETYVRATGIDAVSVDQHLPLGWIAGHLQPHVTVQGNLDPALLLTGGDALREGVERLCAALKKGPFVFNLGHGIMKETPPEHVTALAEILREYA